METCSVRSLFSLETKTSVPPALLLCCPFSVFGKLVEVYVKGKDRYGRILGVIIFPYGENLNKELVRVE